jgi:hypothetical protein
LVRQDVVEEFISLGSAHDDYGVVLAANGAVDEVATTRQRETLRSQRQSQ